MTSKINLTCYEAEELVRLMRQPEEYLSRIIREQKVALFKSSAAADDVGVNDAGESPCECSLTNNHDDEKNICWCRCHEPDKGAEQ